MRTRDRMAVVWDETWNFCDGYDATASAVLQAFCALTMVAWVQTQVKSYRISEKQSGTWAEPCHPMPVLILINALFILPLSAKSGADSSLPSSAEVNNGQAILSVLHTS
jgi:hypothetical protein